MAAASTTPSLSGDLSTQQPIEETPAPVAIQGHPLRERPAIAGPPPVAPYLPGTLPLASGDSALLEAGLPVRALAPAWVEESVDEARRVNPVEVLLLIVGTALAAWGISIAQSAQQFSWFPKGMQQLMQPYINNNQAVMVGGGLMLLGALVAGLGAQRVLPDKLSGLELPWAPTRFDIPAFFAVIIAIGSQVPLYRHLLARQYTPIDILLFVAGLLLVAFAVYRTRDLGWRSTLRFGWIDWALALFLGCLTAVLNSFNLDGWQWSWVGDEGSFFVAARDISHGQRWDLFDLSLVYGVHPALDSAWQSIFMGRFGASVITWRLSEVLLMGLTAVAVYFLAAALFGRIPAIFASLVVGSSYYMMAFARIAYNNIHAALFATLPVLFLVLAWRKQNPVFAFATGVSMGFCLYTFRAAVLIWPVIGLFLLALFLWKPNRKQYAAWGVLALGFLMVVVPPLIYTPFNEVMMQGQDNAYLQAAGGDLLRAAKVSLVDSSLVYWVNNQWQGHFTNAPLLDPFTGVLALLGLGAALLRSARRAERLALVWFVGSTFFVAVTDFAFEAHLTRAMIVIPAVALLVAIAVVKLAGVLRSGIHLPPLAARLAVVAVIVPVVAFNVYEFYIASPQRGQDNSFMFLIRALQENPDYSVIRVGLSQSEDQNFDLLLGMYPELRSRFQYRSYNGLQNPEPMGPKGHLPVYVVTMEDEQTLPGMKQALAGYYGLISLKDKPGLTRAWVFMPMVQKIP